MRTWLGSKQHSSSNTSSGSFGFSASRVSSLNNVAKMSRLSAERANIGRHCGRSKPQIRIITSSSRILLIATRSLLMSYYVTKQWTEKNNYKTHLTIHYQILLTPDPVFLIIAIARLSGNFAKIFNAKSATHWISCCKLCSVDGSTVKSFGSNPSNTLSMSAGTDSDSTMARSSAGPLSWLVRSDGLNKLLNAIRIECSISKLVKSCAFDCPDTDKRYRLVFNARKCT